MPENIFDPRAQKYADWPSLSKPFIGAFSTGQPVGYAQGVYYFKTGHPTYPAAVPGPWNFDVATINATKDCEAFFGYPITGTLYETDRWNMIDFLVTT